MTRESTDPCITRRRQWGNRGGRWRGPGLAALAASAAASSRCSWSRAAAESGLQSHGGLRCGNRLIDLSLQRVGQRQVPVGVAVARVELDDARAGARSPRRAGSAARGSAPRLKWASALSGLSRTAVSNSRIAASACPAASRPLPRLKRTRSSFGASRTAVRRCSIPSAIRPCACSTVPRLLCTSASPGSRRSASSSCACASATRRTCR